MKDFFGLGKGTEKLLDVMSKAVGTLYKPISIKNEGEAEAYKYKLIQVTFPLKIEPLQT